MGAGLQLVWIYLFILLSLFNYYCYKIVFGLYGELFTLFPSQEDIAYFYTNYIV